MIKIKTYKYNELLINIGLIILFIFSFFLTQSYFGTANYVLFPNLYKGIFAVIIVVAILKMYGKLKMKDKDIKLYLRLILPFIAILIWSIFLCYYIGKLSVKTTINELQTRIIMPVAACAMCYLFGKRLVNCIFWAASINYLIYVIEFIRIYGVTGLLKFVSLTDAATTGHRPLEVHEVTFIYGLLILYYVFTWKKQREPFKLIISIIFCTLGYKRILFAGLAVGILIFYIMGRAKNKNKVIKLISILLFVFCIIWVISTGSGLFFLIADKFGIELNARDKILAFLNGNYEVSLFYIGKGVGYVHNMMYQLVLQGIAGTSGFHNDILLYYIDLGCIPFLLFFSNMIIFISKFVNKNYGFFSTVSYLILLSYTIVCWTTDNLATYPNYLLVYNILVIVLITSRQQIKSI